MKLFGETAWPWHWGPHTKPRRPHIETMSQREVHQAGKWKTSLFNTNLFQILKYCYTQYPLNFFSHLRLLWLPVRLFIQIIMYKYKYFHYIALEYDATWDTCKSWVNWKIMYLSGIHYCSTYNQINFWMNGKYTTNILPLCAITHMCTIHRR
jgi:hypothetical protein